MVKDYACRKCKALTLGRVCPNCHSTELSPNWSGYIVIFDVEQSRVAKTLSITRPGRYALRVS